MVRGSGGRRQDFMTRAGRASPSKPECRAYSSTARPIPGYRVAGHGSVEGTLGIARVVSRPFSHFEGHLGAAKKPILLPGPGQLDQIAGSDQAPAGKSRERLVIHRSISRAEKPSIFEGALLAWSTASTRTPMWSSSPVGMPAGPHPPRYRGSDRRSLRSPARSSNSA